MRIKFKEGVSEFKDGEYYRANDGQPFDVDRRVAEELLNHPSGAFEIAGKDEEAPEEIAQEKEPEAPSAEKEPTRRRNR